jgi:NADH-ubiquinone oxidoreductase chain 5
MALLLIALPLSAAILAGFGGRWLGGAGAARLTTGAVGLTFLLSAFTFFEVALHGAPCRVELVNWLSTEAGAIGWSFLLDPLTVVRLIVVTGISTLVHLYSTEYRSEDPHLPRFRASLSLFTFFRLRLVTAGNLLQRFVGWEGVGLASYLLINFWFGRLQANKAAIKARLLNRVGDRGLSLALFLLYTRFGTLDYAVLFSLAPARQNEVVILPNLFSLIDASAPRLAIPLLDRVAFLLLIGARGKSAQLGLHTWLPDAREGPTPVSALLHAATRVTAGIFLLCRCSPLLEYAPHTQARLPVVGGRTAFFAATTGLLQNDLKRVIAYSTCSQLGYRLFAAGLSGYALSRFHLTTHAVFKALLFLGAGSVIHARGDEQDRRKRGGLRKILPFTYAARRVGSLALRGFPFLAGFYSKDLILELAYGSFTVEGRFAYTLGSAAAFATAFYSRRLLTLTFYGAPANSLRDSQDATAPLPVRGSRVIYEHAHEPGWARGTPLLLLSLLSLVVGYVLRDRRVGLGTDFWGNSLFIRPTRQFQLEGEWLPRIVKHFPLILALSGAGLATIRYTQSPETLFSLKVSAIGRSLYTFFNKKWRFDKVYAEWVAAPLLRSAYRQRYQNRDRGLLEFLGPQGFASELYRRSRQASALPLGFLFRTLALRRGAISTRLLVVALWPTLIPFREIGALSVLLLAVTV